MPEPAYDSGNFPTHGKKDQAPAVVSSSVSVEKQSTAAAVVGPRSLNGASSRIIDGDGPPQHDGGGGSGGDKLPTIVRIDELDEKEDKLDQEEYASDTFESLGELSLTR